MKLFHFYRVEDQTGVSGTGPVVEGVEFTNGWCALRWLSEESSMCFYQSMEDVKKIHGHGGRTEVIIHDFEPLNKRVTPLGRERFEVLMEIIDEASRITSLAEELDATSRPEYRAAIHRLRVFVERLEAGTAQEPEVPRTA